MSFNYDREFFKKNYYNGGYRCCEGPCVGSCCTEKKCCGRNVDYEFNAYHQKNGHQDWMSYDNDWDRNISCDCDDRRRDCDCKSDNRWRSDNQWRRDNQWRSDNQWRRDNQWGKVNRLRRQLSYRNLDKKNGYRKW